MKEQVSTLRRVVQTAPAQAGHICGSKLTADNMPVKLAEGGLRCDGLYKQSTDTFPVVTFITVVRNNKNTLLHCMESVWAQTYDNVEYIIVDGASTDGTLRLIEKYSAQIDYFVSQADQGIYDAMNKALALASGQLINLLNSDDWAEPGAAMEAVRLYREHPYDFLGGAGNVYQPSGKLAFVWFPRMVNQGTIFYGAPMLHQSVYATADCYERIGRFDDSYRIIADFKQMIDVYRKGLRISRSSMVLANFMQGGMSADQETDLQERLRLIQEYFPFLQEREALALHHELDVTAFWMGLEREENKEILFRLIEKYKDQTMFLQSVAEAMTFRYVELKQLYVPRPAWKEDKAMGPYRWLRSVIKRGFKRK